MYIAKLNRKSDGSVYVITEHNYTVDGVYEGLLNHDNVDVNSIQVYTGEHLTGNKITNYLVTVPTSTPWKRYIKVFSAAASIYITYETTGDTVEADDINVLQEHIERHDEQISLAATKLEGIEVGANNYTHPPTHPPSIIRQDENNRFVSDAEKDKWNGAGDMTRAEFVGESAPGIVRAAQIAQVAVAAGTVPWNGIPDKPTTFPPAAHTHVAAPLPIASTTQAGIVQFSSGVLDNADNKAATASDLFSTFNIASAAAAQNNYPQATGTATAISVSIPALTSDYQSWENGMTFGFVAAFDGSGTNTTLNLNSTSDYPLLGDGTTEPPSIEFGHSYRARWDSQNNRFFLIGNSGNEIPLVFLQLTALAAFVWHANGTATALQVDLDFPNDVESDITELLKLSVLASADNNGAATTLQIDAFPPINLYLEYTTTPPTLLAGRVYDIWINADATCAYVRG